MRAVRIRDGLALVAGMGIGAYLYGGLYETRRLELVRRTLHLPNWTGKPVRAAVIADPHIRDEWSVAHTQRACRMALGTRPDVILLLGDYVSFWHERAASLVADGLAPLVETNIPKIAVAGNHDYFAGNAEALRVILEPLGITYLINQHAQAAGVTWVGVDSAVKGNPQPMESLMAAPADGPLVVLWHEPDWADSLPCGPDLMISGHTHGGQFLMPWGWAPGLPKGGRRFVRGFFPHLPVPLYVSRGVGTTGPPSRLFCPAEVSLLTLTA